MGKNTSMLQVYHLTNKWNFIVREHYNKVKYCPVCGSNRVGVPDDSIMEFSWVCNDCGCWFTVD